MADRILVIDDDEAVTSMLSKAIRSMMLCEVHEAADPSRASDLMKLYSYSLVLADLSFTPGGMEGLALIKEVAAMPLRPGLVAISGNEIASAAAIEVGADAFLAKPMRLAKLIATLRQVLDDRKLALPPALST
jgi:DNA-binding NtrC family response regulator